MTFQRHPHSRWLTLENVLQLNILSYVIWVFMMSKFSFSRLLVCIAVLLVLIVLHVIPLPILEVLILFVMIVRPRWFKNLVDQIYNQKDINQSDE